MGSSARFDHRTARARHPDTMILDAGVQFAAVLVLEDEGLESGAEVGGHLVVVSRRQGHLATSPEHFTGNVRRNSSTG